MITRIKEVNCMTVLVIGLGSMGKRRIRLLQKYDAQMRIVGIDSNMERCKIAEREYSIIIYNELQRAFEEENVDRAFICTAPLSHAELIEYCLKRGLHVFTELNLVDHLYKENIELAKKVNKVLFLSSTFLYRKEIEYMAKRIYEKNERVNYVYHAGQYLPDWHPWENYKNFFVGQKETGGCREFMAIEFPWIIEVFGEIKSVQAWADKMSNLELDYPDNYLILLEHLNGNRGMIAFDIVSRKASRNMEIFGKELYLKWDGTPEGLIRYDFETKEDLVIKLYDTIDKRTDYSSSIIEDAYYQEIENFFEVIENNEVPKYSFEKDLKIINLINQIENQAGGK